jgi:hypothetical protein
MVPFAIGGVCMFLNRHLSLPLIHGTNLFIQWKQSATSAAFSPQPNPPTGRPGPT